MMYKEILAALFVLFLFCSVTFNDVIAGNNVFSTPDQLSAASIGHGIENHHEISGQYPKWNPWIFSGLPSTHSMQHVSRFYPPNIIIKGLAAIGLPWFWNYLLHYLFAGLGCFVLLRGLNARFWSSVFGAVGFMLTPYMVTMIVHGHGSQMMTAAYIPWVFWGLHKCISQPGLRNAGILAVLLGLQLLRGHVQIAYYTWLLVGSYLLLYIIPLIRYKKYIELKAVFQVIGAMVMALLISMILYYPAKSYTPFSIRGSGDGGGTGFDYATQWSFSVGEMLTFFNPSYYGFGGSTYWGNMPFTDYPNYMGILLLTLALFAIYRIAGLVKSVLFFGLISALLLSFGHNMFIYELFYDYFPFFNKFRVPAMFLILVQFSVAILGGLGLNSILNDSNSNLRKTFLAFVGGISGILIISGFAAKGLMKESVKYIPKLTAIRMEMIHDDLIRVLVILLISAGMIYFLKNMNLKLPVLEIGCVFLLGIDLGIINERIIHPHERKVLMKSSKFNQRHYEDGVIRFLKEDKTDFRILPLGPLMNDNRWAAFQLKNAGGYHPAKLANYQNMMSDVGFNSFGFLQMMNIKYLISLEPLNHPLFPMVYEGNLKFQGRNLKASVYENKLPVKSIFIPEKIVQEKNGKNIINQLKSPSYSPQDLVFVSNPPKGANNVGGNGEITKSNSSPDLISCTVKRNSPGLIVFSEVYYPNGWTATVDGEPTEIIEVNGLLRGVFVDQGQHQIEMIFDPQDLKTGKYLSALGWLICMGLIGLSFVKSKRSEVIN